MAITYAQSHNAVLRRHLEPKQDTLVFGYIGRGDPLVAMSASGGEVRPVTTLKPDEGETDHRWPFLLPDGEALLFTVWSGPAGGENPETAQLAVQVLATGERRSLLAGSFPRYVPTGHIVFVRSDGLWAAPFDIDRLEVSGPERPVLEEVNVWARTGRGEFALADNGTLVYVEESGASHERRLVWVDRAGNEESIDVDPAPYANPRISPDGRHVAVEIHDGDLVADIWVLDLERGVPSRLTRDPAADTDPLWTSDGERIVFRSGRAGSVGLYSRAADGGGGAELILDASDREITPSSWDVERRRLLVGSRRFEGQDDIGFVSMDGEPTWKPLLAESYTENNPAVSPDGQSMAYISSESGRIEVYVRPYPDVGNARNQISDGGGDDPVWSRDGNELFYRSPAAFLPRFSTFLEGYPQLAMMAVPVRSGSSFSVGVAKQLFEDVYYFAPGRHYDVAPDGRFLMVKDEDSPDDGRQHINIVLYWFEELRRLVPTE